MPGAQPVCTGCPGARLWPPRGQPGLRGSADCLLAPEAWGHVRPQQLLRQVPVPLTKVLGPGRPGEPAVTETVLTYVEWSPAITQEGRRNHCLTHAGISGREPNPLSTLWVLILVFMLIVLLIIAKSRLLGLCLCREPPSWSDGDRSYSFFCDHSSWQLFEK